MKFLKYSLISLATLVLIGSAGYLFAASGIQSKPGYADLTMPGWMSTDTAIAVKLGPMGLKPVRWMVDRVANKPGREFDMSKQVLLSVLDDLEGVQLRIYEVEDNRQVFDQAIDDSIVTLKQDNWQTLISVQEDDDRLVVMQAGDDDLIEGLSVLASTPENAVFINLVGQISPESIAAIADRLHRI